MLINGLTMPLASLNKTKQHKVSAALPALPPLASCVCVGRSWADDWPAGARPGPALRILRFISGRRHKQTKNSYRPLPSGQLDTFGVWATLRSAGPLPGLGPRPGCQNVTFRSFGPFFRGFWAGQPPIVGYTGFERGEEKREKN